MSWTSTVLTLFPQMFPGPLEFSLAGRGLKSGLWKLNLLNIRDFSHMPHNAVDDSPYGGGVGMLMRPDIVHNALLHSMTYYESLPPIIYFTPKGQPLTQSVVQPIASQQKGCILLCGRYEGIDERVIEFWKAHHNLLEISVGDYILSGGEIAALSFLDACIRLLPGIVIKKEALTQESFELDLLEFPQYTKPREWKGMGVPDVLLSGDHRKIQQWRFAQSKLITQQRRPDLLRRQERES